MSRCALYTPVFVGWKHTSNHVNYCFFNLQRGGDSPCTGSEGRPSYLVSSLETTLRKACSDTEMFPRLPRGIESMTSSAKGCANDSCENNPFSWVLFLFTQHCAFYGVECWSGVLEWSGNIFWSGKVGYFAIHSAKLDHRKYQEHKLHSASVGVSSYQTW